MIGSQEDVVADSFAGDYRPGGKTYGGVAECGK
jgi:hypothetical protein